MAAIPTKKRGNPALIKEGEEAVKRVRDWFGHHHGNFTAGDCAKSLGMSYGRVLRAIKIIREEG